MILLTQLKNVNSLHNQPASWLASKIPCERTNMYDVFKRKDVSVGLLYKVSVILDHDFFLEISEELHKSHEEKSPYSLSNP